MQETAKRKRGRPPKTDASQQETRDRLLREGIAILTEKGFTATGLDSLLREASVPKGSFYHYFPNKDAYGLAVVQSYADYFESKLNKILLNQNRAPLDRIRDYVEDAKTGMARYDFKRGCLIGNMGQELGHLNDTFRAPLEAVFQDWQGKMSLCLREAQRKGTLSMTTNADELAAFFWIGWEGAILRAKLTQSAEPLDLFADHFMNYLNTLNKNEEETT